MFKQILCTLTMRSKSQIPQNIKKLCGSKVKSTEKKLKFSNKKRMFGKKHQRSCDTLSFRRIIGKRRGTNQFDSTNNNEKYFFGS